MTKKHYFEMCEALGNEPVESEIPVEYEDLFIDVQEALGIYAILRDEWDTMNGIYLGKNYSNITDIFTMYDVPREDWKTVFELLVLIDKHRSEIFRKKQANKK